jgi:hypothetical protein
VNDPDRNDAAFWLPRLEATGVPTPRTAIVPTGVDLVELLDGRTPDGYQAFLDHLTSAVEAIGGAPCFIRTGHGSGKHDWDRTCWLRSVADLPQHVAALVEWSHEVDILGLPTGTWAVRELLDAGAPFYAFRGMPIGRERRYFVAEGRVVCHHPYWPPDSIRNPDRPDWRPLLDALNAEPAEEVELLTALTLQAARQLDGAWSIDWLFVPGRGWVAIDAAKAGRSFHWPGCPHAPQKDCG